MGYQIVGYKGKEVPIKYMVVDRRKIVVLHPTNYSNSRNARQYLSKYFTHFKKIAKYYGCNYILIVRDFDDKLYQIYYIYQIE